MRKDPAKTKDRRRKHAAIIPRAKAVGCQRAKLNGENAKTGAAKGTEIGAAGDSERSRRQQAADESGKGSKKRRKAAAGEGSNLGERRRKSS